MYTGCTLWHFSPRHAELWLVRFDKKPVCSILVNTWHDRCPAPANPEKYTTLNPTICLHIPTTHLVCEPVTAVHTNLRFWIVDFLVSHVTCCDRRCSRRKPQETSLLRSLHNIRARNRCSDFSSLSLLCFSSLFVCFFFLINKLEFEYIYFCL